MFILYGIPKNLLSYWVGKLMHIQWPRPLRRYLIKTFAQMYRINLDEAEKSLDEYTSVGDFFTRRLKAGVRPIGLTDYVHPADSLMTARGSVQKQQLIQAKGRTYSLAHFLDVPSTLPWEDGFFITYYLCPTDYHRVHSPVDGWIKEVRSVPGQLWPVNDWSVSHIDELFVKNERVIIEIETPKGPVAVVLVGATNVGSIRLSFAPEVRTNHTHRRYPQKWSYPENSMKIQKGDELGMFCMGSTVIVVASKAWKELSTITQTQTPVTVRYGASPA